VLSFELKSPASSGVADQLEIILDSAGLEALIAQLRFLKEGRTDHVHLMSEAWGDTHLSKGPQTPANTTIHSVKIYRR
jgi:hypothetical protein